ncbi:MULTISPECIES: hypothetical protein [unclassified Streptomyces]|uniref:hypothetical protein n=1 Tax=unclassified Streptomyces TaxID=2593676 RepID=UPI001BE8B4F4|nr:MULTISPECIES: hypothetical protein [unclassified Streptomyces]MBT2405125.1 hypothetical protein [Streptomyces sp. ISL-21]MBT2459555.1 hypothetical protein [Streptomyces sp. ISL-86]MBT2610893.1 hypothetical protein [Streptomyces sp. ISL-87]
MSRRLPAVPWLRPHPRPRLFPGRHPHPQPHPGPADGLRTHSTALRSHAERLRLAARALDWQGPQADAFRAEVEALADRCATAANGLALGAAQLDEE